MKKHHINSRVYGSITQDEKARAYRLGYVQAGRGDARDPYQFRSNSRGGPMLSAMWESGRSDARAMKPMREF